jgi:hypothetical protein
MSVLRYNGITLDIVKTLNYERRPVYDGCCYLYTIHKVLVEAVVSPAATSYDFTHETTLQAGVNAPPAAVNIKNGFVPGGIPTSQGAKATADFATANNANNSDVAIRHLLLQKRGRLVYTAGERVSALNPNIPFTTFRGGAQTSLILDMPSIVGPKVPPPDRRPAVANVDPDAAPDVPIMFDELTASEPEFVGTWGGITADYVCDCTDGPTPFAYDVIRIDGMGTFKIRYGIQCAINEARFFFNRPPVMLSHLWRADVDVNTDGFSTRVISGKVVFRRDVLEQQGVRPDDFRSLVVHPLCDNMKRESLRISQLEDGNTLRYEIVDREYSHRIGYPNIMRVEAFARIGMRRHGVERVATEIGAIALDATIDTLQGNIFGIVKNLYNILPSSYLDAVVRLWGNNLTTLRYLRNAGIRILANRLGDVTTNLNTIIVDEGYDWVGKYVELHWNIEMSGVIGALDVLNLRNLSKDPQAPNLNAQVYDRVRDDSTIETGNLLGGVGGVAGGVGNIFLAPQLANGFPILDAQLAIPKEGRGFITYMKNNQIVSEDPNKGTWWGACVAQVFYDSSFNPAPPPANQPIVGNFKTLAY